MTETQGSGSQSTTSSALIALAWLLVGLPLSWGVYRSALNAVKLFQAPPAAATAPASPAAMPNKP